MKSLRDWFAEVLPDRMVARDGPVQRTEPALGERKVFARPGERVTCERGHRIATVAAMIYVGDFHRPGLIVDWCFGDEPAGVWPVPVCQCGAIWFGSPLGYMHIEGEWR